MELHTIVIELSKERNRTCPVSYVMKSLRDETDTKNSDPVRRLEFDAGTSATIKRPFVPERAAVQPTAVDMSADINIKEGSPISGVMADGPALQQRWRYVQVP